MPKDRERSHEDKDREKRSHSRSSSSRHRRPKHSSGRRESSREHRRHRPYQREKDSLSSTHIYFTGSDITPSVSVHTDHVTLASNLSSLVNTQDGMLEIFENCCQMLERLRQDQATNSALWRSSSSSSSDGSRHRGANKSNLVPVPLTATKKSKPRWGCVRHWAMLWRQTQPPGREVQTLYFTGTLAGSQVPIVSNIIWVYFFRCKVFILWAEKYSKSFRDGYGSSIPLPFGVDWWLLSIGLWNRDAV